MSQWGHDFRPDYLRLGDVARALDARSIFAATATATPRVAADVARRLGLRDPVRITTGFDRPNLSYDVVKRRLRARQARRRRWRCSREPDALPAIVYAGTRKKTEETAAWLQPRARPARCPPTTPGWSASARAEAQRAFMAGETPGRGRDQRLRHGRRQGRRAHGDPRGRARPRWRPTTRRPAAAGATGSPSRCVLLAENRDKGLHVFFINQVDDPEAKNHRWRQYREVWGFVEGDGLPAARRSCATSATAPSRRADGRCCDVCDGPLPSAVMPSREPRLAQRATSDGRRSTKAIVGVVEARRAPGRAHEDGRDPARRAQQGAAQVLATTRCRATASSPTGGPTTCSPEVDALIDAGRLRSTGGRYPTLRVARAA